VTKPQNLIRTTVGKTKIDRRKKEIGNISICTTKLRGNNRLVRKTFERKKPFSAKVATFPVEKASLFSDTTFGDKNL
jgi:hypothetical protein